MTRSTTTSSSTAGRWESFPTDLSWRIAGRGRHLPSSLRHGLQNKTRSPEAQICLNCLPVRVFCYFVDVFSGTHYSRKSRWSIRRGHNRLFTLKEKRKRKIRFLLHSPSRSAASAEAPAPPSAACRRRCPRPPPARHRCPLPPAHAADLGALVAACRRRRSPPNHDGEVQGVVRRRPSRRASSGSCS